MNKFDLKSYQMYLFISIADGHKKHILVEGKDDKYLVEKLWHDLFAEKNLTGTKIIVDSADALIKIEENNSPIGSNNRKVEFVTNSIVEKPYKDGFVGFADREFDKFELTCDLNVELQDFLGNHEIAHRLAKSRGHSIENYIFDIHLLCETLEILSMTAYTRKAIGLFKETFEPSLRIACSLGLVASKAQILSRIKSVIDYDLIQITSNNQVIFNLDDWLAKVGERNITDEKIQTIKNDYEIYKEQVSKASFSLVRWMCHGHIGYDFLRALYIRCLVESCPSENDKQKELSGITWVAKDKMLYAFINSWVKKIEQNQYEEYPRCIFELLNLV